MTLVWEFNFPNAVEIEKEVTLLILNTNFVKKIILINKAYHLLIKLKEINSKKCITFLRSIIECEEFIKILALVDAFVGLDFESHQITCNTSKKEREKILNKFNSNKKVQILCNVHVLDEGIDIPKCDVVYLTNPIDNIINVIQRISRCNRIDKNNPDKIANVLLWAKDDFKIKK